MKHIKKILLLALMIGFSLISFATEVKAATGYQGYAIYRDGTYGKWHAGMMDEPSASAYLPIVQHPGSTSGSGHVEYTDLIGFKDGNTFMGVYRPWAEPSTYYRDLFVAKGRKLVTDYIPYNLLYQINYDTSTSGAYVDDYEISSMRCDGVVEYIHEWYDFRIYGNDTYWDVTVNSDAGREHHSGTLITPKTQTYYMTKITPYEPYFIEDLIFDANFYADKYPDLKAAFGYNRTALFAHWTANGLKEGRTSSYVFDPVYYLKNNSDLSAAFGTNYTQAYQHFLTYGYNEGRASSPVYKGSYYQNYYSDLKTMNFYTLIQHFLGYGIQEGRRACSTFDPKIYSQRYSDLRNAFGTSNYKPYFNHYLINGIKEGRTGI